MVLYHIKRILAELRYDLMRGLQPYSAYRAGGKIPLDSRYVGRQLALIFKHAELPSVARVVFPSSAQTQKIALCNVGHNAEDRMKSAIVALKRQYNEPRILACINYFFDRAGKRTASRSTRRAGIGATVCLFKYTSGTHFVTPSLS